MNRYAAAGIVQDVRDGREVMVLSESSSAAQQAFTEVMESMQPDEVVLAHRTNGRQHLSHASGGSVKFWRILTSGLVPKNGSVVYMDGWHSLTSNDQNRLSLLLSMATCEVVRP